MSLWLTYQLPIFFKLVNFLISRRTLNPSQIHKSLGQNIQAMLQVFLPLHIPYFFNTQVLTVNQHLRSTPVLESLFNKVTGPQASNLTKKKTRTQVLSCEISKIFKNTYFEEHLRTTASKNPVLLDLGEVEKLKSSLNRLFSFATSRTGKIFAVSL